MIYGRIILMWLAGFSALVAVTLQFPGQISYDSSAQLYEAFTGISISWNPPFMSALLKWLGGGEMATAMFVAINSAATYGSLMAIIGLSWRHRFSLGPTLAAAAVILNPLLMCYVGIVWKDVLFGSWLVVAFVLTITADQAGTRHNRLVLAAVAALFIAVGFFIRQQGHLIAPLLLIGPLTVAWRATEGRMRWIALVAIAAVFGLAAFSVSSAVTRSIKGNDGRSISTGLYAIAKFDIAGITVQEPLKTALADEPGLTVQDYEQLKTHYTAARVDFLGSLPFLQHITRGGGERTLISVWLKLIMDHPLAYLKHRMRVMQDLLSFHDFKGCLPTWVGIDGNAEYLSAVGMQNGVNARAAALGRYARLFFGTPIWRNWFYVLTLTCVLIYTLLRRSVPHRSIILIFTAAMMIFVLSFIPTAIACDFRYLYPIIPAVSAILLVLLSARSVPLDGNVM